jgi:hypothetical protein
LLAGDVAATIANAGGTYNNLNVIGATTLTVNGLTVSGVTGTLGSAGSDYSVPAGSASIPATIAPAPVTLSGVRVADGTTVFAASAFGTAGTIPTGIGTETLAVTGAGSVASANAGLPQPLTVGSLALGNGTGSASNYTIASAGNTGTITVVAGNSVLPSFLLPPPPPVVSALVLQGTKQPDPQSSPDDIPAGDGKSATNKIPICR